MEVLFLHKHQTEIAKLSQILPFDFATTCPASGNYTKVIRWGNIAAVNGSAEEVNPRSAIFKSRSYQRVFATMRMNGVRCPKVVYTTKPKGKSIKTPAGYFILKNSYVRRYRVYLFDLKVLGMLRYSETTVDEFPMANPYYSTEASSSPWQQKEWDKVCISAARGLYYLGLIFGAVDVGVEKTGRVVVYHVDAAPHLTEYLVKAYSHALQDYVAGKSHQGKLTLGADPEFMLRNRITKNMIMASHFFPQKGLVGCDQRSAAGRKKRFPLAELRPKPESDPLLLFENLRGAMHVAIKLVPYNNIEWLAGSEPFPGYQIGGHVHFGNCWPSTAMMQALDNYLAIPALLVENGLSAKKRRSRYGFLGDFRWQHYGGFEYRTLGCWLVSPRIARAVLCLAYLVAHNHRRLKHNFLAGTLRRDFYIGRKESFYGVFRKLWETISAIPEYASYEKELSCFAEMVRERKRWRENVDIRKTWKIPIPKTTYYGG